MAASVAFSPLPTPGISVSKQDKGNGLLFAVKRNRNFTNIKISIILRIEKCQGGNEGNGGICGRGDIISLRNTYRCGRKLCQCSGLLIARSNFH